MQAHTNDKHFSELIDHAAFFFSFTSPIEQGILILKNYFHFDVAHTHTPREQNLISGNIPTPPAR